jgi:hypothetical protein
MIASVIFKCSKVSTTPIYATIIENPCSTNNNYHGEKIHRPLPTSRGARQRRGDRTQGARARSQPKKAGDTSQVFRPKWSDPSLLGASLTLGTTSCRPKAQSILRWHAVSVWRRGVRFGSLAFWSLALQKATAFFGCSKGTKCCRLQL